MVVYAVEFPPKKRCSVLTTANENRLSFLSVLFNNIFEVKLNNLLIDS